MTVIKRIGSPSELVEKTAEGIILLERQYLSMLEGSTGKKPHGLPDIRAKSLDYYREALADADVILYVAEDEGRVEGYLYGKVMLEPDDMVAPPFLEIFEIVVDMNMRGRGVGTLLLKASENYARDRGIKTIQLAVHEFNQNAIRFYQDKGFKTIMRKMIREL
ncbi:MAG: GNAT family N-acetyltransferase [candidate division WOR-3 bacterium]